jgi:hypothetical protein
MNATAHKRASVSLPRVVDRKEGGLLVVAISGLRESVDIPVTDGSGRM